MRSGNYMTADRMIVLSDAALRVLRSYSTMEKEIARYIENATEITTETVADLLFRHRISIEDTLIITREAGHFKTHAKRNDRSKDLQRFAREEQQALKNGDYLNNEVDFIQEPAIAQNNDELHSLWEKLRATYGAAFVFDKDIFATLEIDENKSPISSLVKNGFLKSTGLPNRFFIVDL